MSLGPYIAGAAGLLTAYMHFESYFVSLVYFQMGFHKLPESFDGLRILHLSDTHTTKFGLLEQIAQTIINSLDYDICIITGDLSTTPEAISHIDRIISSRKHDCPVYVVTGNSEYKPWTDNESIVESCRCHGYVALSNSSEEFRNQDSSIYFAGVDYAYTHHHNVDKAFASIPENSFIIGLTHRPSITDEMISHGAALTLAGHTHGGQIRLPGLGVIWSHMSRNMQLNDGYYSSERLSSILGIDAGDAQLFVNRGLGTSRFHLRLNCRPQIALIRLRAAD